MTWLPALKKGILSWNKLFPFSSQVILNHYSCYLGEWELPQGYKTGISVYNSATNEKVPLVLKNKDVITWYVCGPTVYAESHIGHASCYVKFDIIRRIMETTFGINVSYLMGITDIDDKIIKKSIEVGLSVSEVSKKYERDFFKDMCAMRVKPPTAVCRVTENIPCIISFCERLIEKDYAYVTDEGNVYFMVSKGVSSDVLFDLPEESQVIIDQKKRDKRDFALWKAAKENEPFWLSPWGKGRPGWHIECSAMASKTFGSHLDLHSGGYDLLFPHHSNEKSQSEAYHGCKQWGNYWLHSGLLQVDDGTKMSKSINNTISVRQFLEENCVNDFRMLCLQSPYRKNISYSEETLTGAKGLHNKFHNFINESESYIAEAVEISSINGANLLSKLESTKKEITSLFTDDFNTSKALLCLTLLIDEINESLQLSSTPSDCGTNGLMAIAACAKYIDNILDTLGVTIICKERLKSDFVQFMDAVNQFRVQIRLFAMCQIKTEEQQTVVEFIDNIYQSYSRSKNLIDKEKLYEIYSNIDEDVNAMYKKASEYALTLPKAKDVSGDSIKVEKKNRIKFLYLCDELRASLNEHGIIVKDKKNISTWYPSVKFSLR